MPKYRVTFETQVQIDGFTSWKDTEHETMRERITVEAKNLHGAKIAAVKKAHGYYTYRWGVKHHSWWAGNIKKITRLKKRERSKRSCN